MIKELSELGKQLRDKNSKEKIVHDALKEEMISIDLVIGEDGSFKNLNVIEKISRPAEALTSKKGKARLLLDKAEEILNFDSFKHNLFLKKLNEYENLESVKPVLLFYQNPNEGVEKAKEQFLLIPEKERIGNIAFRVDGKDLRIHEEPEIYNAIIEKYEAAQQKSLNGNKKICSVCGKNDYPVENSPHGMIARVPEGQSSGCALVSFNEKAFESYGLEGNLNSSVCINCAKTYVEGLNWLLKNGSEGQNEKGKSTFKYSNRKNFGTSDTAMVYWLKDGCSFDELELLETPNEEGINSLFNAVISGEKKVLNSVEDNQFYSFTLSGAAARIAVRDWIQLSLGDLKKSLKGWFERIRIEQFDYEKKKMVKYYPGLYNLAKSTQNEKNNNDVTMSRVITYLWKSALTERDIPLWILSAVLKRNRFDDKGITKERASLIRLVLNQNYLKGDKEMKESLDNENTEIAYVSGRLFCVLENLQRAALGSNINSGIRERFFSAASMTPSSAFGRLLRMAQNHISKLKGEKPGLAVVFDKELQELLSKIEKFPVLFKLEEQGQFAIGYYHQKQETFRKAADNKELKDSIEE